MAVTPTRTVSRSKTLHASAGRSLQASTSVNTSTSIPTLDGVEFEEAKLGALRKWILGIAIVNFDLELGPSLTCVFPPIPLYPFEAENIAFSAFPDSPQFAEGSQIHSFRISEQRGSSSSSSTKAPQSRSSGVGERPPSTDGFLYGFSHFTQRRDSTVKRGYEQRSVVILTHHPYPALFMSVLSKLGPLHQLHGDAILEVACHNILSWSAPTPGKVVELGFLGSVLHVQLPENLDEQQLNGLITTRIVQTDPDLHILASAPPPNPLPLLLFEASLSHLWSIWECLVLCEPILIFGSSPAMTSQAVWWLRDLFRPIPWVGDFRPFFTIHDKDHSILVNEKQPKAGLLLGVTNPFFERACKHWPHVLSLGKARPKSLKDLSTSGGNTAVTGPPPGWKTKTHKRYISKDKILFVQMEDALRGGSQTMLTASNDLRRHFSARTSELLVPLNRYLNTLIPSPSETIRHHAQYETLQQMTFVRAPSPSSESVLSSTSTATTALAATSPSHSPMTGFSASPASQPTAHSNQLHPHQESSSAQSTSNLSSSLSRLSTSPSSSASSRPASSHILASSSSPSIHPPTRSPSLPPTQRPLRLKPFSQHAFLSSLKTHGSPLPFRSKAKEREFYERWLRTPAFGMWLARQEEVVEKVLRERGGG
ncbi:DUF1630-domain-containing protein [Stereum hirsutum FP-91666 SS1]|uniref:DUF1630-domain-containing protein n=1 Tax=Stereum hirsutum (strain FP-91666) TaxID=721885 RepID=UPI000440D53E|nr:DUF1630-domain-containing protein [Stereum hirsutum FP-91666 SS1]EIM91458.1 DUF1630-domain-containing protein [Stereum hirsutum FP-91666 SS1]